MEIDVEQTQNQHNFVFNLPLELRGAPSVSDSAKPFKSVYYQVQVSEKKVHITLPADFPVAEIRLDPETQLLFQEKMITK